MEGVSLINLNFNITISWHEELLNAIALVNDMILEIKRPFRSELPCNRFRIYDKETFIHSANVSLLTILIARKMGYQGQSLREIARGALLHDLGKLRVPKRILNKPGKLTEEEYNWVKKHPLYGMELIRAFHLPKTIQQSILQHHERWNGTGYPLGLKADQIHPNAQIVAVADVLAALTADRPYRKGMGAKRAVEIIEDGKGKDFSPIVVDQVLKVFTAAH